MTDRTLAIVVGGSLFGLWWFARQQEQLAAAPATAPASSRITQLSVTAPGAGMVNGRTTAIAAAPGTSPAALNPAPADPIFAPAAPTPATYTPPPTPAFALGPPGTVGSFPNGVPVSPAAFAWTLTRAFSVGILGSPAALSQINVAADPMLGSYGNSGFGWAVYRAGVYQGTYSNWKPGSDVMLASPTIAANLEAAVQPNGYMR